MRISAKKARAVLEEAVSQLQGIQVEGAWVDQVQELSALCQEKDKTMIAALGTAMLAKATDLRVDVLSLQVGEGDSASTYSARALCKEVLAADANRLGIDLGVTGREPLNNSPFYKMTRISRELKVRPDSKAALDKLNSILESLQGVNTETMARQILQSFLQVRKRKAVVVRLSSVVGDTISETELVRKVNQFVAGNSEGGKRAQAVALALLSLVYPRDLIVAKRVNDPSRQMPGDIGILSGKSSHSFRKVFEVKDKPVNDTDIQLLVDSAQAFQVANVCMLAVNKEQQVLDEGALVRWAGSRGIRFRIFTGWDQFIKETLFWADLQGPSLNDAVDLVSEKATFYEVSEDGIRNWGA